MLVVFSDCRDHIQSSAKELLTAVLTRQLQRLAFMANLIRSAMVVQCLLVAAPVNALTPTAEATATAGHESDSYHALVDAIFLHDSLDEKTERTFAMVKADFAQRPSIQTLEASYPGVSAAMAEATKPIIRRAMARHVVTIRATWHDFLKGMLTPQQAGEAAAFYSSALGRKIVDGAVAARSTAAETREIRQQLGPQGNGNLKVSQNAVSTDTKTSTTRLMTSLGPTETREIEMRLRGKIWAIRLNAAQQKMAEIRARLENLGYTADEEAAMNAALREVVLRFKTAKAGG